MVANSYGYIRSQFRLRFGPDSLLAVLAGDDSKGGHLLHATRSLLPEATLAATRDRAWSQFQEIVLWFRDGGLRLAASDRLETLIRLPETVKPSGGQIYRGRIDLQMLRLLPHGFSFGEFLRAGGSVREMRGWDLGVFATR